MPVAGDPVQVGQLVRRYRIVRELGRGGFGVVFQATDEELKRTVAIKFLLSKDKKDNERFFREAIASTRVDHPSVVQILEFGKTEDSYPFIVMEFIKGRVLTDLLRDARAAGKVLGWEGLPFIWQIALVLAETHERGIVHRDLKPPNVMLVPDPMVAGGQRVKILDFGIAKILPHAVDGDEHGLIGSPTAKGEHPGTPAFMAPEQWKTHSNKDGKIDVYALGCMLYMFFAGRLPFEAGNAYALLMMHVAEDPEPLEKLAPSTPAEVAKLAHAMLAKNASERPTMAEVRDELAQILGIKPLSGAQVRIRPTTELDQMLAQAPKAGSGDSAAVGALQTDAPTVDGPSSDQISVSSMRGADSNSGISDRSTDPKRSAGTPVSGAASDSLSRTPGQQITSPDTQAARRRTKTRLVLGGAVLALLAVSGVALRVVLRPVSPPPVIRQDLPPPVGTPPAKPPAPMDVKPAIPAPVVPVQPEPAPILTAPPEKVPAKATPSAPVETPRAPSKGRTPAPCTPIEISDACISGSVSKADKQAILSALNEAEIKLCAGDFLNVAGRPSVAIKEFSGVRKSKHEPFVLAIKGALKKNFFAGEAVIRCKR